MEKEETKTRITKSTQGYGYKYAELSDINKYCEDNNIRYYQEIETSEINHEDYIVTYVSEDGKSYVRHRGCKIVDAKLSGINNPVQEYGSSLTYCRRYSLLLALGLATEDDDAQSVSKPVARPQSKVVQKAVVQKAVTQPIQSTTTPVIYISDNQKTIIKDKFTKEEIKSYLVKIGKLKLSDMSVVEASDFIKSKEAVVNGN